MIKQIGLPLHSRPILLITCMITDRIGLHSVVLPLLTRLITELIYGLVQYVLVVLIFTAQSHTPLLNCLS